LVAFLAVPCRWIIGAVLLQDDALGAVATRAPSLLSIRRVPLCVIPEGAGTVNPCREMVWALCGVLSVVAGSRQPADGVRVERPQRSEDERPWDRQGLTQDEAKRERLPGSMASFQADVAGVAAPSPATAGRGQPEARVPVIPSPRQGGMELCGRSRAGSIKWATTPPGGGHDTHEHAPGCARAVHIACLGAGARQRTWPSRRP